MQAAEQSRKIEVKKRGNALGFWFFKVFLRFFGLRGTYNLLYLVALYYALFDRSAISATMAYIKRRFPGHGYLKKRFYVYKLFISQGRQLIDRYTLMSKRQMFDIKLRGYEELVPLTQDPQKGLVLLMAHVGNWQVVMTTLKELNKTVYLLMRLEDNEALQNSLSLSSEQKHIKIISPEGYLGGVLEIMNVLKEGHVVAMMGDREYGFNAIGVTFLGNKARFPYSAFTIAAAAECPVITLFSTKMSDYEYSVDVARVMHPSFEKGRDRHGQLKDWVQEFAISLQEYINKHPYQCFLFHDVWKERRENGGMNGRN